MAQDFEIIHIGEDDEPIGRSILPPVRDTAVPFGNLPMHTADHAPEYEVLETDGSRHTYGPSSNIPVLDAVTQAKVNAVAHQMAARILRGETRKSKLNERRANRTAKSRRKRTLERASRKRNW